MTEQVPRTVFVQTTTQRSPAQETILGVRYQFVSVSIARSTTCWLTSAILKILIKSLTTCVAYF